MKNGIFVYKNENCMKRMHEFFDIMMSSYKMEMKPPREYKAKELDSFTSPLLIIASDRDIFFPADKVFAKAERSLKGR